VIAAGPLLSIVVAVRNQREHNRLFLESLARYSRLPRELLVVDNGSTDGSAELFAAAGARLLPTGGNLCYPEAMNLGLAEARGAFVGFLNNDVYLAPGWDEALVEALEAGPLDVVSPSGLEKMPTARLTDLFCRRWDVVKRRIRSRGEKDLRRMLAEMYGDWERFCAAVRERFRGCLVPGIGGNCVVGRRETFERLGRWDPRLQSGDWDLYLRLRQRAEARGDVRPAMVVGSAYVHHFVRATLDAERAPFTCTHPRLSLEEKWGRAAIQRWWSDPEQVAERPRLARSPAAYLRFRWSRLQRQGRRAALRLRAHLGGLPGPEDLLQALHAERVA
jgi:GT2 family glycosyltransferase